MAIEDDDLCSCGHRYRLDDKEDDNVRTHALQESQMSAMDASFVHLPDASKVHRSRTRPSLDPLGSSSRPTTVDRSLLANSSGHFVRDSQSGFLGRYHHLKALEKALQNPFDPSVRLCPICLERVERAIRADTDLMERQMETYRETVRDEELRCESWNRTFAAWNQMEAGPEAPHRSDETGTTTTTTTVMERQADAFRDEIEALKAAVQQHEQEIITLEQVRWEQAAALRQLEWVQVAIEEERNALEIDAKAFDNAQDLLHARLSEVLGEVDRLTSPKLQFTFLLHDLQVDRERGLRYPLINDLRLAYRPKGDVSWEEIQGAWSLAAQLLLHVATIFDFQSVQWKIVPLSHCAKLIYTEGTDDPGNSAQPSRQQRCAVYNLGHPLTDASRALLAWIALLHRVVQHTTVRLLQAVENGLLDAMPRDLPYAMSPSKIGDHVLGRLSSHDDAAWSRVIHCMASNLLWLSECASAYVTQTAALLASVPAAVPSGESQ